MRDCTIQSHLPAENNERNWIKHFLKPHNWRQLGQNLKEGVPGMWAQHRELHLIWDFADSGPGGGVWAVLWIIWLLYGGGFGIQGLPNGGGWEWVARAGGNFICGSNLKEVTLEIKVYNDSVMFQNAEICCTA